MPVDTSQKRVEEAYEAYKWLAAELCMHLDTGEEEMKLYPRLHLIGDVLEHLLARQQEVKSRSSEGPT